MFQSRSFILLFHILGLLFFLSIPIIFLGQNLTSDKLPGILTSRPYWIFCGFYILLFYVNSYLLIPRLYLQKKYFLYAGIILMLFGAAFYFKPFDQLVSYVSRGLAPNRADFPPPNNSAPLSPPVMEEELPAGPRPMRQPFNDRRPPGPPPGRNVPLDIVSLFLFVMVVSLNLAVETSQQWRTTQKKAWQAEADKAKAELSLLKAQINPHFLFNILNNIYSLAITQNENTAGAILKLSNIMRYLTDEVKADFVPLKSEVAYIQDYIDLQKLRLSKKVKLDFSIAGDLEHKQIAPLILITFIENTFKYGLSNHQESALTISLKAEEHQIVFVCQNPIIPTNVPLERTGIGLDNTKARLQYLYPGKHSLTISTEKDVFTVILILPV